VTREAILDGIRAVFAEHLNVPDGVTPETNIVGDLRLDSLELLTLVVELENHFRVAFAEGDEQGVVTVSDLLDLVERTLASQQVTAHA
jgi:acyl carrier protein